MGTFNKIHLVRSVDLFTLRLFLSIVEEGQVGRAAARENIAASAATKRIQDLEEIVAVKLFERTPRGATPTAAGLVLARHVSKIFETIEDIRRDINDFTEGVRGTIRVCSTGGLISLYISGEIAEFARNFPLVDIDLVEAVNPETVRHIVSGEADVGIYVQTPGLSEEGLDIVPYRTDRLLAVVGRKHPLAEREQVKVTEVLAHNLIGVEPATSLMAHIRQAAASAGVEFKPKYNVNSVYAATGLVMVNQGVCILPENLLSAAHFNWITTVPLDEPWAKRSLVAATRKGAKLSLAASNFLQQLTSRVG